MAALGFDAKDAIRLKLEQAAQALTNSAPKQPVSAFDLFGASLQKQYGITDDLIHTPKFASIIQEAWRNLKPEDKAPYEASALQDVERYNNAQRMYDQMQHQYTNLKNLAQAAGIAQDQINQFTQPHQGAAPTAAATATGAHQHPPPHHHHDHHHHQQQQQLQFQQQGYLSQPNPYQQPVYPNNNNNGGVRPHLTLLQQAVASAAVAARGTYQQQQQYQGPSGWGGAMPQQQIYDTNTNNNMYYNYNNQQQQQQQQQYGNSGYGGNRKRPAEAPAAPTTASSKRRAAAAAAAVVPLVVPTANDRVDVLCAGIKGTFYVADGDVICHCPTCKTKPAYTRVMTCTAWEHHCGMGHIADWRSSITVMPGSCPECPGNYSNMTVHEWLHVKRFEDGQVPRNGTGATATTTTTTNNNNNNAYSRPSSAPEGRGGRGGGGRYQPQEYVHHNNTGSLKKQASIPRGGSRLPSREEGDPGRGGGGGYIGQVISPKLKSFDEYYTLQHGAPSGPSHRTNNNNNTYEQQHAPWRDGQNGNFTPIYARFSAERCNACDGDTDFDYDQLITCDCCGVAVHQSCYGIMDAPDPEQPWFCRGCEATLMMPYVGGSSNTNNGSNNTGSSSRGAAGGRRSLASSRPSSLSPSPLPQCCLCPVVGGALKPATIPGLWVHIACLQWLPEVTVSNSEEMEPVEGVMSISKDRWEMSCGICKQTMGAKVQCDTCYTAFHPLCARMNGNLMFSQDLPSGEVKMNKYCKRHGNKALSSASPEIQQHMAAIQQQPGIVKIDDNDDRHLHLLQAMSIMWHHTTTIPLAVIGQHRIGPKCYNGQPYKITPLPKKAVLPVSRGGAAKATSLYSVDWQRETHGTGTGVGSEVGFWIPGSGGTEGNDNGLDGGDALMTTIKEEENDDDDDDDDDDDGGEEDEGQEGVIHAVAAVMGDIIDQVAVPSEPKIKEEEEEEEEEVDNEGEVLVKGPRSSDGALEGDELVNATEELAEKKRLEADREEAEELVHQHQHQQQQHQQQQQQQQPAAPDIPPQPTPTPTPTPTIIKIFNKTPAELVGYNLRIWWPEDAEWYECSVVGWNKDTHRHCIAYPQDNTSEWIDLHAEFCSHRLQLLGLSSLGGGGGGGGEKDKNDEKDDERTEGCPPPPPPPPLPPSSSPAPSQPPPPLPPHLKTYASLGPAAKGLKVGVWSKQDACFYYGIIEHYREEDTTHFILFNDGRSGWLPLARMQDHLVDWTQAASTNTDDNGNDNDNGGGDGENVIAGTTAAAAAGGGGGGVMNKDTKMKLPKTVPVYCNDLRGTFHLDKCLVELKNNNSNGSNSGRVLISPGAFERMAGRGNAKRWKQTLKIDDHGDGGSCGETTMEEWFRKRSVDTAILGRSGGGGGGGRKRELGRRSFTTTSNSSARPSYMIPLPTTTTGTDTVIDDNDDDDVGGGAVLGHRPTCTCAVCSRARKNNATANKRKRALDGQYTTTTTNNINGSRWGKRAFITASPALVTTGPQPTNTLDSLPLSRCWTPEDWAAYRLERMKEIISQQQQQGGGGGGGGGVNTTNTTNNNNAAAAPSSYDSDRAGILALLRRPIFTASQPYLPCIYEDNNDDGSLGGDVVGKPNTTTTTTIKAVGPVVSVGYQTRQASRAPPISLRQKLDLENMTERHRLTFGKSGIHGWGLFAKTPTPQDTLVAEYRGTLLRKSVADKREAQYRAEGKDCYLFDIDGEVVLDSTQSGTISRFTNHSCSPSLYARLLEVGGGDGGGEARLAFFARYDLAAGQELTYNYRFEVVEGEESMVCTCGAPNCKGYLS